MDMHTCAGSLLGDGHKLLFQITNLCLKPPIYISNHNVDYISLPIIFPIDYPSNYHVLFIFSIPAGHQKTTPHTSIESDDEQRKQMPVYGWMKFTADDGKKAVPWARA
jgi:hypothetical protein